MEKLGRHRNLTEGRERQAAGAEALCVKAVGFPFVPQAWSLLLCPASALEASALEHRAHTVHCFSRGRHLQIVVGQQPTSKHELAEKLGNLRHTISAPLLIP